MLDKRVIAAKVGANLRTTLRERANASGLRDPIPELMWGRWEDEQEDSYSIGFYERDEIPANEPIRIVVVDGIEFLIVQDWICAELEGKTLEIVNRKLTLF